MSAPEVLALMPSLRIAAASDTDLSRAGIRSLRLIAGEHSATAVQSQGESAFVQSAVDERGTRAWDRMAPGTYTLVADFGDRVGVFPVTISPGKHVALQMAPDGSISEARAVWPWLLLGGIVIAGGVTYWYYTREEREAKKVPAPYAASSDDYFAGRPALLPPPSSHLG
ncbi:MAG: hypothetical protein JNK72_24605 [Myxococcales bacterium]|nr:hypothetical protein [Myxococcales bacterium]